MDSTRQTTPPKRSIEDRFAEIAEELDLELDAPGSESRMVGIAIAPVAHDAKGTGGGKPGRVGAKDNQAIKKLLTNWHKLAPSQLPKKWKSFATDPYIVVLPRGLKRMNQAATAAWLKSKQFKDAIEQFGPYNPRRASISSLKIVYVGNAVAAATYTTKETGRNGVASGNACAILRKVSADWRIAALSANTQFKPKSKKR